MEGRLDPDLPLFADRTGPTGFAHRGQGRGMVHLDYDEDGDQDIVIFNNQGRPALLRNDAIQPGRPAAGGWLRVFLDTTAGVTPPAIRPRPRTASARGSSSPRAAPSRCAPCSAAPAT